MNLVKDQEKHLPIFLGKFLTESKNQESQEQNASQRSGRFSKKADFERQSWTRIAYTEDAKNDIIHLFAAGNHISLPRKEKTNIQAFCEHFYYSPESLKPLFKYNEFVQLFKAMNKSGHVVTC